MWLVLIVVTGLGGLAALIMYACLVVSSRYNDGAEHQCGEQQGKDDAEK